ncbi:hypothetical protein MPH61_23430 [Peribacillus muralis]|uniref:hypothetical protein n=1 Tax=Peribacillus muralis TaxID=264697 RepID=UPI001F4DC1A5|nr:hypothetical protein [Peribacillus muralis]MCK1995478.1 hypothetical protein [Peribacillus muralis]MCK2016061.1 hypothetical protein [Peribacillus muralis]
MKPLNPFFETKKVPSKTFTNSNNVRKKPITKSEGRKERCDKKKDVKIPFNTYERKLIKKLARLNGLDPTPYCTDLVIKALKSNYSFPDLPYDPKGQPYPVKLELFFHDKLFHYKIEWDCSLKEAAYRIISYMLNVEERKLL